MYLFNLLRYNKKFSKEELAVLTKQRHNRNYEVCQRLSIVLMVLLIILLFIEILLFHYFSIETKGYNNLIFLNLLFFTGLFFYWMLIFSNMYFLQKDKIKKISYLYLTGLILLWCSLLSINAQYIHNQISTYIIGVLATSFFVILTSLQSLVFFGGSLLIFSIGIIILNTDPVQISGYILNAVICVALACFISKINYRFFVEDYINKRDLINKKKKLEEHERSNTIFLANTSHELKTPLNLIYSSEQMLDIYLEKFITESEVKKKFSRYLNIIRQNCYRLMRIIGNIVDSTKMEVGEYKIDINNYNIIAIIEQIVESIRSYIETQGINFSFTTHRDRKVIACDPDSIERILLNLISNAVKYTPEGGRIEVQVYTEGEEVVLSIKDNGCGIPHELQSSIFERYVQSDDSFTKKLGGSGIGLSLVRYLVEMHQGDIELNSVPGEGSEFIIKLPDRLVAEPEQTIDEEILDNDKIIENIKLEFSDIYTDLN